MPNERFNSYWVPQVLDVEAMKEATQLLTGTHDFHNFCSLKTDVENTVRTITRIRIIKEEDMIKLRITGDGFLYNMVRIIVGGLLKIGFHKKDMDDMKRSLLAKDRCVVGPTAPAHGLTLVEIQYL